MALFNFVFTVAHKLEMPSSYIILAFICPKLFFALALRNSQKPAAPRAAKRGKESGGVPEQIRLELIVIDLVRAVRILRELREGFLSLL